jgi:hypothetical protein
MSFAKSHSTVVCVAVVAALALFGCGGSGDSVNAQLLTSGEVPAEVTAAQVDATAQFPKPGAHSLEQVYGLGKIQAQMALGNGTLIPGQQRLAFAAITKDGNPVYGPTVVYVAKKSGGKVYGPFAAPADPMVPQAAYLSKAEAMDEGSLKAIYESEVRLATAGKWSAVSLTKTPQGVVAAYAPDVVVAASSSIPNIGDRMPSAQTLTNNSTAVGPIDSRDPKAPTLHERSLSAVLGETPVALMVSSPKYCVSRVCGPVTDLLLQLQAAYGKQLTAIQQEAYSPAYPKAAPQLKQLELVSADGSFSEPWFFTVDQAGVIRGRLEGAFGINAMNAAIKAALGTKQQ